MPKSAGWGLIGLITVFMGCSRQQGKGPGELVGRAWDDAKPHAAASRPKPSGRTAARADEGSAGETPTTEPQGDVLALVNGQPIYGSQVADLLWKGRGDAVLDVLIELAAVRNCASLHGVRITEADVRHEMDQALELIGHSEAIRKMTAELKGERRREWMQDYLRTEYRRARGISMEEFLLTLRRNAYLRRLVVKDLRFKEEELRDEFARMYGEKVQVRHILLPDLGRAEQAMKRLRKNEPFESVAQAMSTDPGSRESGGLLPPFTRQDGRYPEVFRMAAFDLKVGEFSKVIATPMGYEIIKLERRIPASEVKLELVRDAVEERLKKRRVFELMDQLRRQIMQAAKVQITDPNLAEQYRRRHGNRQVAAE